uniref:Uncharacterized protein n=1 Tax=Arundo donax TaxID=35708 RepID=A0A0A9B971_ARUDO
MLQEYSRMWMEYLLEVLAVETMPGPCNTLFFFLGLRPAWHRGLCHARSSWIGPHVGPEMVHLYLNNSMF